MVTSKNKEIKLLVVADEHGTIKAAMTTRGLRSGNAPTETGLVVPSGHKLHEIKLPGELADSERPKLKDYYVKGEEGRATLVKRSSGGKSK
jgi:hypothetical protein